MSYLLNLVVNSGIVNIVPGEPTPVTIGSLLFSLVITIVLAIVGYLVVKKLMIMLFKEDEVANSKAAAPVDGNTVINVDGNETSTTMTIEGEKVNGEDETIRGKSEEVKNDKKIRSLPISVVIMFALSGAYLLFDWLWSLLTGFGVV